VVAIAPAAERLAAGLFGYHLDFPGDPLAPGCDYERWARRMTRASEPVVYARLAAEPERPGRLAIYGCASASSRRLPRAATCCPRKRRRQKGKVW
jgi:hypothetical protein